MKPTFYQTWLDINDIEYKEKFIGRSQVRHKLTGIGTSHPYASSLYCNLIVYN